MVKHSSYRILGVSILLLLLTNCNDSSRLTAPAGDSEVERPLTSDLSHQGLDSSFQLAGSPVVLAPAPTCSDPQTRTASANIAEDFSPADVYQLPVGGLPILWGWGPPFSPTPARDEGYFAWNSVRGGDRSTVYNGGAGGWCCMYGWTSNTFATPDPPPEPGQGIRLEFRHSVTLTNRAEFRGGRGPEDNNKQINDAVLREGRVDFEGFEPTLGKLAEAKVRLALEREWMSIMTLCDDGFIGYNAEGILSAATDFNFSIGRADATLSTEGRSGLIQILGSIPHKTSWTCGLGTAVDFLNSGAMGGGPDLYDAMLCMLDPEECSYEAPDWSDVYERHWSDPAPEIREFGFSPDQYGDLLDETGNLPVQFSKLDKTAFWFEGGDTFDSGSFTNQLNLSATAEYHYVPSSPEVAITQWSTVSGQRSTPQIPALVGSPVALEGAFCNAGREGSHLASIDWGDGNSDDLGSTTGSAEGSHIFSSPGTFTVTLRVEDSYGKAGTYAVEVSVISPEDYVLELATSIGALSQEASVDPEAREALAKAYDELVGNRNDSGNGTENGNGNKSGKGQGNGMNGANTKLEMGVGRAWEQMLEHALRYLQNAAAADPALDLTEEMARIQLLLEVGPTG